jgi:hypothetical protein
LTSLSFFGSIKIVIARSAFDKNLNLSTNNSYSPLNNKSTTMHFENINIKLINKISTSYVFQNPFNEFHCIKTTEGW